MSHITLTEVGQDLDRIVSLTDSAAGVGAGEALVASRRRRSTTRTSCSRPAAAIPLPDLIYRGVSLHTVYIVSWIRGMPRERLEQIYCELANLVAEGALSAEIEATYGLDQFTKALVHAQRPARSGKVLFAPGLQPA